MHIQTYQVFSDGQKQTSSLCLRVDVYLESIHHNLALSPTLIWRTATFPHPSNVLRRSIWNSWWQLWIANLSSIIPESLYLISVKRKWYEIWIFNNISSCSVCGNKLLINFEYTHRFLPYGVQGPVSYRFYLHMTDGMISSWSCHLLFIIIFQGWPYNITQMALEAESDSFWPGNACFQTDFCLCGLSSPGFHSSYPQDFGRVDSSIWQELNSKNTWLSYLLLASMRVFMFYWKWL